MKTRLFAVVPIIGAALLGLVLSQLTIGDQATGQQPTPKRVAFDEVKVETVEAEVNDLAIVPEYVPAEEGAGYKPPVEDDGSCKCKCNGNCLDEAGIRKIVKEEIDKHCLHEPTVPRTQQLMPLVSHLGFAKDPDEITATSAGETKVVMYTLKNFRCSACDYVKRRKVPEWRAKGYKVTIVEVSRAELDSPNGKIPYFDVCEDGGCRRLSYQEMMQNFSVSSNVISSPVITSSYSTSSPVIYSSQDCSSGVCSPMYSQPVSSGYYRTTSPLIYSSGRFYSGNCSTCK